MPSTSRLGNGAHPLLQTEQHGGLVLRTQIYKRQAPRRLAGIQKLYHETHQGWTNKFGDRTPAGEVCFVIRCPSQSCLRLCALQVVLGSVMLRRKKSALQGDALQLPDRHVHVVQCQFSDDEQELYQALEKRFRSKIDNLIKASLMKTRLACVLEMILRLRQGV